MASSFDSFLTELGRRHRVLLIGGLAVIAHGLSRPTKDADVWLEPFDSPEEWAARLLEVLALYPDAALYSLFDRQIMPASALPEIIQCDRVVRITGLSTDIDIFRQPNGLDIHQFEEVWRQSQKWSETVQVVDPIHLVLTKFDTGREQDLGDVIFLEARIRSSFGAQLETASPAEARALLDRFADHVVLARALKNPHEEVRDMAWQLVREFAAAGDPFAADMLKEQDGPLRRGE